MTFLIIRKNNEYEHVKSKFDMINQAMKEKLMRNNHDLDNFRSGLKNDIDKSLNTISRSKIGDSNPNERNFIGEFNNLLKKQNLEGSGRENLEVKNSYLK